MINHPQGLMEIAPYVRNQISPPQPKINDNVQSNLLILTYYKVGHDA